ncbi:hypothetical protein RED65_12484 [Oceanobacter sp. RED65]|uniref:Uncharacterized protein n=1 Tax=Bermanella marisrubri TaxID=207949 RepID=Q1N3I6_9GAMM|nr:hypothetical protein RED65_12484 [Oceanobacter sp. RED65] [Bermanella marisrubri]
MEPPIFSAQYFGENFIDLKA